MKYLLLVSCFALLTPFSVSAQETPAAAKAHADSLRTTLECPTAVSWPVLPPPKTVSVTFAADGRQASGTASQIQVPQYALFYDPASGHCRPVIVTNAEEWGASWEAVDPQATEPKTGQAPLPYFDFLGREIPDRDSGG